MDAVDVIRRHKYLLCLLAALVTGCGGRSSDSADPQRGRIRFVDAPERTALPIGTTTFSVSPPMSGNEQGACTLNGAAATPCVTSPSAGEISYQALPPGLHRLRVELRSTNDGAVLGSAEHTLEVVEPQVVVFGATPGGITSAIAAARAGRTVVLVEPTAWVGGMMSGGLAKTDVGVRGHEIVGGLTAEFFRKLRTRELVKGVCPAGRCEIYDFEPHEAEVTFEELLADARVIVERSTQLLDVHKDGTTLRRIVTSRGDVSGAMFIDASYEGDLMALANVPYELGREARVLADPIDDPVQLALQEDDAGTLPYRLSRGLFVDPYVVPGDSTSGTLPFVEARPALFSNAGDGDSRVMAYTYRLCVTDDPSNRMSFDAPPGYDPAQYEASARVATAWAQTGVDLGEAMFNPEPTVLSANRAFHKYDLNGGSTFSIDMTAPGLNQAYVNADEAGRERIRQAYRDYIRGLLHFWQTDPRFGSLNGKMARFGYCRDEFADRGNWPHQMYVRIARRMVGEYVMNENDVLQNGRRPPIADPVGLGAYNIDMHTYRYVAAPADWPDGIRRDALTLEGFQIVSLPNDNPYPVSYRTLLPRAADATNLLNPVTLSATNVAYSSLRMEPTFMILGESAGIAAALALETQQDVQAIDYNVLRQRLLANGQRLP